MFGRCHDITSNEQRVLGWPGVSGRTNLSRPLVTHPLELAAYPPDDISIDPLQGGTQLRPIEVAVVGDPAADARVVHLGQFGQGAGRITWDMFPQIKQRQPILQPKLYLPYRELQ